jgi:hypothetical protein
MNDEQRQCALYPGTLPPPIQFVRKGPRNTAGLLQADQAMALDNMQESQPSQSFIIPFGARRPRNSAGLAHADQTLASDITPESQPYQPFIDEIKVNHQDCCLESDYQALFVLHESDIIEDIELTNGLNV